MEHEQMTGDVEEEHRLQVSPEELKVIRETLLDRSLTMAQRYRSVFTLRNIGGNEAISILAECMPSSSLVLTTGAIRLLIIRHRLFNLL
jgi:hypothetical protein